MSDSTTLFVLSGKDLMPPVYRIVVLMVDDQPIVGEAVKRLLSDQPDIFFHYCSDPSAAISTAQKIHPTVILQDLVMPEIDGITLVKAFRAKKETGDIPIIVLSSKEEPKIKAEAFASGANDYLVKIPDKVELIARIRYHSDSYIRLLERNDAYRRLEESQRVLNEELAEAAAYVRSLLPLPLTGAVRSDWRFIPSTQLGGDAFGYHHVDSTRFAIYLLDVCGHGVGAALLSISVINLLRSQTLPDADFKNPASVLTALNRAFQMETQNNMFFTVWYGVYDSEDSTLVYSTGGHPPAVLFTKDSLDGEPDLHQLTSEGTAIGVVPDSRYENRKCALKKYNRLYLFSDGVYEIRNREGQMKGLEEFIETLSKHARDPDSELDSIVSAAREMQGSTLFEDDFSLLRLRF